MSNAAEPLEAAKVKMAAAFEFFEKLGVPFWCFHDRDIAPEGDSLKESFAALDVSTTAATDPSSATSTALVAVVDTSIPNK